MKSFREQFSECNKNGFCRETKFISFKDHPSLIPFLKTPNSELDENGFNAIICGKFGGYCHSHKKLCQELRGMFIIPKLP